MFSSFLRSKTAAALRTRIAGVSQLSRQLQTTSFRLPKPAPTTNHVSTLPLVKMVATIGPTSEQQEPLQKVVKEGMKIMRLNFSHATPEEVELRCTNLALAQVSVAVVVSMQTYAFLFLSHSDVITLLLRFHLID
jgi:pyruvate kinase